MSQPMSLMYRLLQETQADDLVQDMDLIMVTKTQELVIGPLSLKFYVMLRASVSLEELIGCKELLAVFAELVQAMIAKGRANSIASVNIMYSKEMILDKRTFAT